MIRTVKLTSSAIHYSAWDRFFFTRLWSRFPVTIPVTLPVLLGLACPTRVSNIISRQCFSTPVNIRYQVLKNAYGRSFTQAVLAGGNAQPCTWGAHGPRSRSVHRGREHWTSESRLNYANHVTFESFTCTCPAQYHQTPGQWHDHCWSWNSAMPWFKVTHAGMTISTGHYVHGDIIGVCQCL